MGCIFHCSVRLGPHQQVPSSATLRKQLISSKLYFNFVKNGAHLEASVHGHPICSMRIHII